MKTKLSVLLISSLLSSVALAVDVSQCPKKVSLSAEVTKVNKTSIYGSEMGWKEAQATLKQLKPMTAVFNLGKKTEASCVYSDGNGNTLSLTTVNFNDPEESSPVPTDLLIMTLKSQASKFVSYIPVNTYSPAGIALYSRPFSLKIKTRLSNSYRKSFDVDLGMVSVSVE